MPPLTSCLTSFLGIRDRRLRLTLITDGVCLCEWRCTPVIGQDSFRRVKQERILIWPCVRNFVRMVRAGNAVCGSALRRLTRPVRVFQCSGRVCAQGLGVAGCVADPAGACVPVFRQGDRGTNWYAVLSGSVAAFSSRDATDKLKQVSPTQTQRELIPLTHGLSLCTCRQYLKQKLQGQMHTSVSAQKYVLVAR